MQGGLTCVVSGGSCAIAAVGLPAIVISAGIAAAAVLVGYGVYRMLDLQAKSQVRLPSEKIVYLLE